MRLLIVSLRGPTRAARSGGAQAYVQAVGSAWAREGHAVRLVCAQERDPLPARETIGGVEVYRVGSSGARLAPLLGAIRAHASGADAVLENLMAAPLALPLWLGAPVVALKHHLHAAGRAAVLDRTLLPLAYRSTPLVVPSERTAEAVRRLGPRRAPVHVLPPPILAPEAGFAHASGASRSPQPTVLYLGALHLGRKRVDDLIGAFRSVTREVPRARLIIAGDGPDREALEDRARGLPVTFRGHVSDAEKARLYAEAWVLASPSTQEGFGITWIEAGAWGVPLVGYQLDGLETVGPASSLLVASGDVGALARALTDVLTDPGLRQRLSDGARSNAARFTTDATSRALLALLRDAAAL